MKISKYIKNQIKRQSREYSPDALVKIIGGRSSEIVNDYDSKLAQYKNEGQAQKSTFKANKKISINNRKDKLEKQFLGKAVKDFQTSLFKSKYDQKGKEIKERRNQNNANAQMRLEMKRQKNLDYLKEQGLI